MHWRQPAITVLLACAALLHAGLAAGTEKPSPNAAGLHEADVLYLPTPHHVVEAMLKLAGVGRGDVLYDLGSGDGRIPIAAAKLYGIRAVGVELDARLVAVARRDAEANGVAHLVEFRQQDMFETDIADATVITLFLFPELNLRLRPRLQAELRPGARVVSHRFDMGDWRAQREVQQRGHPIYLWTIPAPGGKRKQP